MTENDTKRPKIAIVGDGRGAGRILKAHIELLEELEAYRAIGTVEKLSKIKELYDKAKWLLDDERKKRRSYEAIGTIEEFKALKEKNEDCIIKHLTNECSYNETGCSDCKGKETIRVAVEIVKKMYEHCEGSCVDCPYHNPNMDKCMNDLLKLK